MIDTFRHKGKMYSIESNVETLLRSPRENAALFFVKMINYEFWIKK